MSNIIRHNYHLVDDSPWPLLIALVGVGLTSGLLNLFYFKGLNVFFFSVLATGLITYQWWRDVRREGAFLGLHRLGVELGLRIGIILFIISEVFFFLSFFWAFFHRRLSVEYRVGNCWPPSGIQCFDAFRIPLLNTIILLSSGVRVTWAHHSLIRGDHKKRLSRLSLTVILGIYFTGLQAMEYLEARFSFADGVYGSTFFLATGFHGLHVIIGTIFLLICLLRINFGFLRYNHHLGFEIAAWYWHFVDVVWLFLYVFVYWWGGA